MISATNTVALSFREAEQLAPERLAGNPHVSQADKIAIASKHFEAILVRQFLTEAQKPLLAPKGQMSGATSEIYRDMMTDTLANQISKSGTLGLARQFQAQFTPHAKDAAGDVAANAKPVAQPQ